MDELNLASLLLWLFSGGGCVMAASWILERSDWYQKLSPKQKEYSFFGVASGLGIGAYLLFTNAPDFINMLQPYFLIVSFVFSYVFLGKIYHTEDKKEKVE